MKVLNSEFKLCTTCMKEHEVKVVERMEKAVIKGKVFEYIGEFEYCDNKESYTAGGEMLDMNGIRKKDTYKTLVSLLTTKEIRDIRYKYNIGQKDLCMILGWGSATLGRYETTQIQDEVHNDILFLVRDNPIWLMRKLESKKQIFLDSGRGKSYTKHYNAVAESAKKQNKQLFGDRLKSE